MTDSRTTAATTSQPRSPRTIAVDNFLRKTLRIADPRNPDQVASALLQRYPAEADRARREMAGFAHSTLPGVVDAPPHHGGAAALAELDQARDDLERDLGSLVASSQLKDIRIELSGWGRAVRQIAADGIAAARSALDAVSFDRALTARRALGDYARLARYVGVLSDGAGAYFRRFAQSCDLLAGLILVGIGEALAAGGITRSTSIIRVSGGDLQMRRNAVISALRNLTGTLDAAADQEQYPRGLEAFRALAVELDEDGQPDLSALLEESILSQAMDDLIDLSTGANVEGLRELSTASSMLVHRFQRLIEYAAASEAAGGDGGFAKSPPLATFVSALQLFVDAFTAGGGSRLLHIARPPITAYGLYGLSGPDAGARTLRDLTMLRGAIAEEADCFSGCGCDEDVLRCQIVVDYLLYAVDRAIDLYAVGTDPDANGEPEKRAAVTGLAIAAVADAWPEDDEEEGECRLPARLRDILEQAEKLLRGSFSAEDLATVARREMRLAYAAEEQVERLVRSLSSGCHAGSVFSNEGMFGDADGVSPLRALFRLVGGLQGTISIRRTIDIPVAQSYGIQSIAEALLPAEEPYYRGGGGAFRARGPSPAPAPEPADEASAAAAQAPSAGAALALVTAFDRHGNADPESPFGRVLVEAGYPTLAAIAAPGLKPVKRSAFVRAVRAKADESPSEQVKQMTDADIITIFDLSPALAAAIREYESKP